MSPILERGNWIKLSINPYKIRLHFRDETEDGYVFRYWSRKWGGHWAYEFIPKVYAKNTFTYITEIGKS